ARGLHLSLRGLGAEPVFVPTVARSVAHTARERSNSHAGAVSGPKGIRLESRFGALRSDEGSNPSPSAHEARSLVSSRFRAIVAHPDDFLRAPGSARPARALLPGPGSGGSPGRPTAPGRREPTVAAQARHWPLRLWFTWPPQGHRPRRQRAGPC